MRETNATAGRLPICTVAATVLAAGCATGGAYPRPGDLSPKPDGMLLARVILAGDGGQPVEADPAETALTDIAGAIAARARESLDGGAPTRVVWLGDNVYPRGVPPASGACAPADPAERARALGALRRQLLGSAGFPASEVRFVPGNHDWEGTDAACGSSWLAEQEASIRQRGARLLPERGCPGPVAEELGPLRLVFVDSEWLLRRSHKDLYECTCLAPGANPTTCLRVEPGDARSEPAVRRAFYRRLEEKLAEPTAAQTLLLAHHPVQSHGEHGGLLTFRHLLFPATAFKSWLYVPLPFLYVLRPLVTGHQDLASRTYREYVTDLGALIERYQEAVLGLAAGHEHNLQLLRFRPPPHEGGERRSPAQPSHVIVSGAASRLTPVGRGTDTVYEDSVRGFVVLDVVDRSGPEFWIEVWTEENLSQPAFRRRLRAASGTRGGD